jgi:hypothetical protein
MARKIHPLHKEIADKLERIFPPNSLVRDEACDGDQRIPLFYDREKSRETEYCNVDLLVMKENKIKAIIEIEESNVKPTQICGKFLTSALARYYIHDNELNEPIGMNDSVAFFQIVDTSKLEGKSAKPGQWKALERSIQSILPLRNSKITSYRLLTPDKLDELTSRIREIMQNDD